MKPTDYWWIPGKKKSKIAGVLSFSIEDGTILETTGIFFRSWNSPPIEIILGISHEGVKFTLFKCFPIQQIESSNGPSAGKYYANYLIRGKHYRNESKIKFNFFEVRLLDLNEWVNNYQAITSKEDALKTTNTLTIPESVQVRLDNNYDL